MSSGLAVPAAAAPSRQRGKAPVVKAPPRVAKAPPRVAKAPPRIAKASPPSASVARLRDGGRAFLAGDYADARKALLPVAMDTSAEALRNRDYALYFLAESEALLGTEPSANPPETKNQNQNPPETKNAEKLLRAALAHFQTLAALPGTRFLALARARAADCLWELGPKEDDKARVAFQAALKSVGAEIDPAVLRFRLAQIEARAGHRVEARAGLRKVYVDHPLHPFAEQALVDLRALDSETRIEAGEHIQRARNMTLSRKWPEALAELQQVPKDVGQAVQDEVDYWAGTTYYKMRHGYEQAADKLLSVAARMKGERQAEAMFHGARALSRADKDQQAIAGYQALVKAHPGSRYAAEASFLTGWLEYNRGRYKEAIPLLQGTLRRYPGPFAEDARWYQGFSRYLLGDYPGALDDFQTLSARPGTLGDKGRYWAGQALVHLGKGAEAQVVWRKLVGIRPLSYYALLARVRLREAKPETKIETKPEAKIDIGPFGDVPSSSPSPVPPLEADPRVARDADVLRVEELLSADLPVEAGYELHRVEGALIGRYGSSHALPVLFDRYQRGQNFQRPHLLAEEYGEGALRQDPHKSAAARRYWELAYPLAYQEYVEKYAPTGQNPPRYLYTIMQKESAYNPHDVSYADAIGLLQMIPPTSQKVAPNIGRAYTDDVLYDPEGNIQFGAWYIGHLLRKFKGQIALGAGSFNAGPKAMLRWLGQHGDRQLDEFIELCAYTQTREYMKKALDIYAHYVYLWDKEEYLPQMHIDKDHATDDGIDY